MSTEILLPKLGLTMDEAKVVTWLKNIGDYVEHEEVIVEVETDKANLEVESPKEGYLVKQVAAPGDVVAVGGVLGILADTKEAVVEDVTSQKKVEQAKEEIIHEDSSANEEKRAQQVKHDEYFIKGNRIRVSPAARKLAREEGIDLRNIAGSGPRGRIILADVKQAIEERENQLVIENENQHPIEAESSNDKIVHLSSMRKIIANRMTESFQHVPQFNLKREVDCTAIEQTRKTLNEINDSIVKLSMNDFLIQAVSRALRQHPRVNASFIDDGNEPYIIEKADVNIGLAVALDDGLVVPVIHHADRLSITEIANKRVQLIEKAKEGKLTPDEMSNGTFTISNLGGFHIDEFTAIVNPPETGILAVGKAKWTPVVNEQKEIEILPIMHISGSFDHRTIDGAEAARFMNTIVEQLQSTKWNVI